MAGRTAIGVLWAGWVAFGTAIGRVVTSVVLVLAYVLVFLPVSLALRVLGRDPLHRRWSRDAGSYWMPIRSERHPAGARRGYERMY